MAEGEETEWYYIFILVICVTLSFICSIIQIGLMSLDIRYIELLTKGPFETKKDE